MRQKARAVAGFPNSRPEHQPGYHLRNPQQQLEDRQHYDRLNFDSQQDEQLKSLMNQELISKLSMQVQQWEFFKNWTLFLSCSLVVFMEFRQKMKFKNNKSITKSNFYFIISLVFHQFVNVMQRPSSES